MKIFSKNQNLAKTLSTFHLVLHKSDQIPLKNFQGEENFLAKWGKIEALQLLPPPPSGKYHKPPLGRGRFHPGRCGGLGILAAQSKNK